MTKCLAEQSKGQTSRTRFIIIILLLRAVGIVTRNLPKILTITDLLFLSLQPFQLNRFPFLFFSPSFRCFICGLFREYNLLVKNIFFMF